MSKIQSFEQIQSWQIARTITKDIYMTFEKLNDKSFKYQIQRASVSNMNNIAEGYARRSDKAFRNFLTIEKGSAVEVESMISVATKLNYITHDAKIELTNRTQEITRMISGLIKKLSAKDS